MQIELNSQITFVPQSDWDRMGSENFPFADYDYLHALETSGSVGGQTGWSPLYLAALSNTKRVGATYLYAKAQSYGEYIFDWGWAEAYQRHGVPYYPKLVSAVPFTPATGPKLLLDPETDRPAVAQALIAAAVQTVEKADASSLHWLFLPKEELAFFEAAGFLLRQSYQYHWHNAGYVRFEDFLAALKPRKRKQIVREREQLKGTGLRFRSLTGEAITPSHAKLFYGFYLSTIGKRQAYPYLTEAFFTTVFATMRDRIVLFVAEEGSEIQAGSLCYFKGDTLFGRYWGAAREVRNLHFELCYYQPIEWAIRQGLKRFEAGAQGEHKLARGFVPTLTYSAHWIRHPAFRDAIEAFIEKEKLGIAEMFEQEKAHSPFAT